MSVSNCRRCGEILIDGQNVLSGIFSKPSAHQCPPTWEARLESKSPDDSEWQEVCAYEADTAATKFAEEYDRDGEYTILTGRGDYVVEVRRQGTEEVKRFAVRGENVPHYYANLAS